MCGISKGKGVWFRTLAASPMGAAYELAVYANDI
jgi:hypothetical protein